MPYQTRRLDVIATTSGKATTETRHDAASGPDLLRADLAQRNAEHETEFYVLVTEAQALDLASGYVPAAVKAMVTTMLDWKAEDRRRAARPVPRSRKKTGGV